MVLFQNGKRQNGKGMMMARKTERARIPARSRSLPQDRAQGNVQEGKGKQRQPRSLRPKEDMTKLAIQEKAVRQMEGEAIGRGELRSMPPGYAMGKGRALEPEEIQALLDHDDPGKWTQTEDSETTKAFERKVLAATKRESDPVKTREWMESVAGEPTDARAPDPPICPRCLGLIPSNDRPGEYPGAWSRRYRHLELGKSINDSTQVCSACGHEEAMLQMSPAMGLATTGVASLDDEVWPVSTGGANARREEAKTKGVSHRTGKMTVRSELKLVRNWPHPVHPRDVAQWRNDLMGAWQPGGVLWNMNPSLSAAGQQFEPQWEFETLKDASLWYVGGEMCSLLDHAAPTLPDHPLDHDICQFPEGLVVFEKPLVGIDAEGSQFPVAVGAMLWGRSIWSGDMSRMLGVTIYGPNPYGIQPPLIPLGTLIWPFGKGPDDGLDWMVDREGRGSNLSATQKASMAEDRRRLMALWLLSSQPGIANRTTFLDRGVERRNQREAEKLHQKPLDSRVRIITLRRPASPSKEDDGEHHGRDWQHQWLVNGHWRNQAYGPDRSLRRPIYIHPFVKGPPDKPFLSGATVRSWVR